MTPFAGRRAASCRGCEQKGEKTGRIARQLGNGGSRDGCATPHHDPAKIGLRQAAARG
jgi:hypothetical protein